MTSNVQVSFESRTKKNITPHSKRRAQGTKEKSQNHFFVFLVAQQGSGRRQPNADKESDSHIRGWVRRKWKASIGGRIPFFTKKTHEYNIFSWSFLRKVETWAVIVFAQEVSSYFVLSTQSSP